MPTFPIAVLFFVLLVFVVYSDRTKLKIRDYFSKVWRYPRLRRSKSYRKTTKNKNNNKNDKATTTTTTTTKRKAEGAGGGAL